MKFVSRDGQTDNRLLLLMIVLLALNTVLFILLFNVLNAQLSQNRDSLVVKQDLAKDLMDYNRKLAQDLDVQNRTSVRESLASFNYEIDMAQDSDELARVIFNYGRQVQETILREWDNKMRERVLVLINQDENVRKIVEPVQITLRYTAQGGLMVEPEGILADETCAAIEDYLTDIPVPQEQVFSFELEKGEGRILLAYSPLDYIQTLTEELNSLRISLHEVMANAGFSELSGPGIRVELYDAHEGYTSSEIIHDADVRDVVNELFASGAKGAAVGGQRLITTSPIRCVGPVIKVNEKEIAANPVVIEAVGDPDVLASGLDIIKFQMEFHRGFRVEVEKLEKLSLPGYSRN